MNLAKEVREFKEYLKVCCNNIKIDIIKQKEKLNACNVISFRYISDEKDPRGFSAIEHKSFKKAQIEKELESAQRRYKNISNVVRNLLEDRATNVDDLMLLTVGALLSAYVDDKNKSIEVFSRIFGMFVSASDLILSNAYNSDGTFTHIVPPTAFSEWFSQIFGSMFTELENAGVKVIDSNEYIDYACDKILEEYAHHAAMSFADHVEATVEKAYKNERAAIIKECREKLAKYYMNGEIICIPEDMTEFDYILNNSNLTKEKIREIMNKLKEKTTEKSKEEDISELLGVDVSIYEYYVDYLAKNQVFDEKYYDIKSQIELIKETINFWLDNKTDSELVELAKEEIKDPLEILRDYKIYDTPNEVSNSHLHFIFKDDDCDLIADFENFPARYYDNISSLIRKINDGLLKDSCYFLNNDGEKISFLNTKFCRVYYKELIPGEYVILALTSPNTSHNTINKRIGSYYQEIKDLKKGLTEKSLDAQYIDDRESIIKMLLESGDNTPKLALLD